jgi:hypothetical protein
VTETTLNGCGGIEQAATSSCPWICFEKPRADGITPPVEESRIGIQTGQALTRLRAVSSSLENTAGQDGERRR